MRFLRGLHLRKVRKNDNKDRLFERKLVAIYFPQTGSVDIDTVMTEPIHSPRGGSFQGAKNKRCQNNSLTT